RADGCPPQQADGDAGRVRGSERQGDDGRRAQVARHDRGREAADGLSRGRPCHRRPQRHRDRPDPQGDDHSAWSCTRHGDAASRAGQAVDVAGADDIAARDHDGRPCRGRTGLRQGEGHVRRLFRYRAGNATGAHDGDALGLSEALGTVSYGENQDEVFLGMSVSRTQNASEATVQKIDTEIRRFVEEGYNEATRILTEKREDLETLAKGLLEFETLSGDEIQDLLKGKKPNRESVLEPTTPRA